MYFFQVRHSKTKSPQAHFATHISNAAIPAVLSAQISALRAPRNIRTRGLTIAEHDPAIEKTARIAGILREICEELSNCKGNLCSSDADKKLSYHKK